MGTRNVRRIPQQLTTTVINQTGTSLTLLAAVTGKRIQIWSCELTLSTAVTVQLLDDTDALTGPMTRTLIQVDPPVPSGQGNIPYKETSIGKALKCTLGSSATIAGEIVWSAEAGD